MKKPPVQPIQSDWDEIHQQAHILLQEIARLKVENTRLLKEIESLGSSVKISARLLEAGIQEMDRIKKQTW